MRTTSGLPSAPVQGLLRRAAVIAQAWRRLFGSTYRPEKHYMRGPGPKWREKYPHFGAGTAGVKRASGPARLE
jgi:hypothetical protein